MTEMRSKKKSKTGSIQGLVSGSIVQGILNAKTPFLIWRTLGADSNRGNVSLVEVFDSPTKRADSLLPTMERDT